MHFRNLVRTKLETFQYSLSFPLVIRGGASFSLTQRILLLSEAVFEQKVGPGFRYGLEYLLGSNYWIRGGLSTKPFQHSVGFGYHWRFCQLDFAMVHHYLLGYSPVCSLSFNLVNK
jgi:hypothetical protein